MISKAARRYAKALLQSAIEQNILTETEKDMRFIDRTLADSSDLRVFLRSPVIKSEVKVKGLLAIFESHISKETKGLFRLLSEKNRENLLPDICKAFTELFNKHQGIINVDVNSAYEMDKKQKNLLHDELEKRTGKTVNIKITIDSELLGGLVVKVGDTVIDGSVKHKIRMLKNQFAVNTAV